MSVAALWVLIGIALAVFSVWTFVKPRQRRHQESALEYVRRMNLAQLRTWLLSVQADKGNNVQCQGVDCEGYYGFASFSGIAEHILHVYLNDIRFLLALAEDYERQSQSSIEEPAILAPVAWALLKSSVKAVADTVCYLRCPKPSVSTADRHRVLHSFDQARACFELLEALYADRHRHTPCSGRFVCAVRSCLAGSGWLEDYRTQETRHRQKLERFKQ